MKKLLLFFALLAIFLFIASPAYSNNIKVDSVSVEDQNVPGKYCFIEFDISWDNSWRTSGIPRNWDAAWIFVKYNVAGSGWYHATLFQTGFVAPTGSDMDITGDSTGVFIYRDASGDGSNNWDNCRLKWDYGTDGVNDDAELEVRVFAIEMVYVPDTSFYLGDGGSKYRFHKGDDTTQAYLVTSEAALTEGNGPTNINAMGYFTGTNPIPAEYPKGFNDFYCMKYEISQEQYVAFLNTLTRAQQNTRTGTDISGTTVTSEYLMYIGSSPQFRNGIACDLTLPATGPINVFCDINDNDIINEPDDGQNIACNCLSWMDQAAYMDWAALRPISEMEFEKACRGPNNPISQEFAWGTTNIHNTLYTMVNADEANESFTGMGVSTGNCNTYYTFTEAPARCGIFAASATNKTRQESGATYYGIMEMSGNVAEFFVTSGNTAGRSYTGKHGDGALDASGDANVDFWPGINGNYDPNAASTEYLGTTGVTDSAGMGYGGGDFSMTDLAPLRISDRQKSNTKTTIRPPWASGRGCRTAP
jgi:formylglycine-generating enzyme required for sulfatase activity